MTIATPTVDEVRAVITTSATDAQVQVAIDDAALIVEACVASLDAARQEAIVKYTAAHLLSTGVGSGTSGVITSQRLGDASESYATAALGEGLYGSAYGKKALALDPNGCLASIGKVTAKWEVL